MFSHLLLLISFSLSFSAIDCRGEKKQIIIFSFSRVGEWMTWEQTSHGTLHSNGKACERTEEKKAWTRVVKFDRSNTVLLIYSCCNIHFNVFRTEFSILSHIKDLLSFMIRASGWNGKSIFDVFVNKTSSDNIWSFNKDRRCSGALIAFGDDDTCNVMTGTTYIRCRSQSQCDVKECFFTFISQFTMWKFARENFNFRCSTKEVWSFKLRLRHHCAT